MWSQAAEIRGALELGKEHLHLLALSTRLLVSGGCREAGRFTARGFMVDAFDFAKWKIRGGSMCFCPTIQSGSAAVADCLAQRLLQPCVAVGHRQITVYVAYSFSPNARAFPRARCHWHIDPRGCRM
jgi:hypothetical protein